MNRWVLLEHKVSSNKNVDIHYDFLVEDEIDCLTWKLFKLPSLNNGFVAIVKQPNHRLVWLSRVNHKLSRNRGFVKRIDYGSFINVFEKSESQDLRIILDGELLNGFFEISGDFCRLTKK